MSLFGRDFVGGALALRIISVGQLINFATGAVGIMLIMSGRSDVAMVNAIVVVAVALGLDFWLVPAYGLNGAAVASALSLGLSNMLRLGEVYYLLRLHPFGIGFLKPMAAALPAALIGWLWLHWLPVNNIVFLALACAAIGVVYLTATLILRLDEGDRIMVAALKRRFRRMMGRPLPAGM